MIPTQLKRNCLLWGWTITGLSLLMITGLCASLWTGVEKSQFTQNIPFGACRVAVYGVLLICWPAIVGRLTNHRCHPMTPLTIRRPLIILILLYECVIVQNPLSALLAVSYTHLTLPTKRIV